MDIWQIIQGMKYFDLKLYDEALSSNTTGASDPSVIRRCPGGKIFRGTEGIPGMGGKDGYLLRR